MEAQGPELAGMVGGLGRVSQGRRSPRAEPRQLCLRTASSRNGGGPGFSRCLYLSNLFYRNGALGSSSVA